MKEIKDTEQKTTHNGQPGQPYDTEHIITDIGLKDGALLHRFAIIPHHLGTNADPVLYSAIYKDGVEVCSNTREREQAMIDKWNETGNYTLRF